MKKKISSVIVIVLFLSTAVLLNAYFSTGIVDNSNKSSICRDDNEGNKTDSKNTSDPAYSVDSKNNGCLSSFVPDYLEPGDIVLLDTQYRGLYDFWDRPGISNDHAVIYIGKGYINNESLFIRDENGMDMFIESLGASQEQMKNHRACGIQINNYSFYDWFENFAFLYVVDDEGNKISKEKKQEAVQWCLDRYHDKKLREKNEPGGYIKDYQYFGNEPFYGVKCENPDAVDKNAAGDLLHDSQNLWYCMELVWAAYKNIGIDIDQNEWKRTLPIPYPGLRRFAFVDGDDIIYDENTRFYEESTHPLLSDTILRSLEKHPFIFPMIRYSLQKIQERIGR